MSFEPWTSDNLDRLLALKKLAPIIKIEGIQGEEEKRYDLLAIAVKIVDLILENMGPGEGITKEAVIDQTSGMLRSVDEAKGEIKDAEFYGSIIRRVIDKMLNVGEREAFSEFYMDYTSVPPVPRTLQFSFLEERYRRGKIVLWTSFEAINLFLHSLSFPIESEKAAKEILIKVLMDKKQFRHAIQAAKENKTLTQLYTEKITRIIDRTERDIEQVDWISKIPTLLTEATNHIDDCVVKEAEMKEWIMVDLGQLDETSGSDMDKIAELRDLNEVLSSTRVIHLDLLKIVMGGIETFLSEQKRQILKKTQPRVHLNLERDVLEKTITFNKQHYDDLMANLMPITGDCEIHPLFEPHALLKGLIANRKPRILYKAEKTNFERRKVFDPPDIFPSRIRGDVCKFLTDAFIGSEGTVSLSSLLDRAASDGFSPWHLDYMVILLLKYYVFKGLEIFENDFNLKVQVADREFSASLHRGTDFNILWERV